MKEILLNKETLESMYGRFETVFSGAVEAASFAEKAESLQHDAAVCGACYKVVVKTRDDVLTIIRTIIEGFSWVDSEARDKAREIGQEYLGTDCANGVYNHNNVVVDQNGIVSTSPVYSERVQEYIYNNLNHLLSINSYNYSGILGRNGDWCDAYVHYIITNSGMHSAGTTNWDTTVLFERLGLRHGYKYDNGSWDEFNNANQASGAHVSNDGYQPRTGDLVWASHGVTTEHVGIYYVDPVTQEAYVLEGNVPDTNLTPAQEFYNRYRHISFGDMTTYNAMVDSGQI